MGLSESTSTRQDSPRALFGGVEALVENQEWWLRDQANLAMSFDNWVSRDLFGGNGNLCDVTGVANGFYTPPDSGNQGNWEDDWSPYASVLDQGSAIT